MNADAHTKQYKPTQHILITDGTEPTTTALSIPGEELPEQVEATIDIIDNMFKHTDGKSHRPLLNPKVQEAIRTVSIFYGRQFPDDPITGELSRMFNSMVTPPKHT